MGEPSCHLLLCDYRKRQCLLRSSSHQRLPLLRRQSHHQSRRPSRRHPLCRKRARVTVTVTAAIPWRSLFEATSTRLPDLCPQSVATALLSPIALRLPRPPVRSLASADDPCPQAAALRPPSLTGRLASRGCHQDQYLRFRPSPRRSPLPYLAPQHHPQLRRMVPTSRDH